jgi:hypothetical protein
MGWRAFQNGRCVRLCVLVAQETKTRLVGVPGYGASPLSGSSSMKSDNLLNITDPDAPIYRIYPKDRFMQLLSTGKNGLVKPAKWDDPFENFFLRSDVSGPGGEKISIAELADNWYWQCWTLNQDTGAMWRIYSHDKDGIKVITTVRKLFDSFYNGSDTFADLKYLIGAVRYWEETVISDFMQTASFRDIAFGGQATGFAELLCVKREAFEHEREVRLLFQDLDPKRSMGNFVPFDLDVNAVFDEVVVDPRLNETDAAALQAEIKAAGCTRNISQSPLYRVPKFNMRLE